MNDVCTDLIQIPWHQKVLSCNSLALCSSWQHCSEQQLPIWLLTTETGTSEHILITMETNNRVLIIQTEVIKILLITLAECWLILAFVAVISFIYAFFSVLLHPLPSFGCLPGFLNVFLVHRAVHLWFWFVAPLPIVEQPEKGHCQSWSNQTNFLYLGITFCAINQWILTRLSIVLLSCFYFVFITICNWAQQANKRHAKILFLQDLKLLLFLYLRTRSLSIA